LVSVRLPPATVARVARLARDRDTTVSAVIRAAIDALDRPAEPSIWDQVRPLISRRGSGLGDLSSNKERLAGFGRS
jgi:Ribbon-helix-helix protein, copG family